MTHERHLREHGPGPFKVLTVKEFGPKNTDHPQHITLAYPDGQPIRDPYNTSQTQIWSGVWFKKSKSSKAKKTSQPA